MADSIARNPNDRLVQHAPAKVNLHLEILGKRPDGYHELETLMVTVSLHDVLTFRDADEGTEVLCEEPSVGPAEENLVTRAIRLVREESKRSDGLCLELTKRIPVAAGLAGGSSDAAATLAGLNQWWRLGWSKDRLKELAAQLGSDVPFFFEAPAAIARGRGEIVTPCPLGRRLDLVLICPPTGLSTASVFRAVRVPNTKTPIEPIAAALEAGDLVEVGKRLFNRLQEASVELSPEVAALNRHASNWDCLGHLMSGSGSCYFALCSSHSQALELERTLNPLGLGRVFVVHSSL